MCACVCVPPSPQTPRPPSPQTPRPPSPPPSPQTPPHCKPHPHRKPPLTPLTQTSASPVPSLLHLTTHTPPAKLPPPLTCRHLPLSSSHRGLVLPPGAPASRLTPRGRAGAQGAKGGGRKEVRPPPPYTTPHDNPTPPGREPGAPRAQGGTSPPPKPTSPRGPKSGSTGAQRRLTSPSNATACRAGRHRGLKEVTPPPNPHNHPWPSREHRGRKEVTTPPNTTPPPPAAWSTGWRKEVT
ncbi:hypothetical protein FKM82_000516 [Ascaphus truei]